VIRTLEERDYAAVADLLRTLQPDAIHTEASVRHTIVTANPRAQLRDWVTEEGGAIVAYATSFAVWWRAGDDARAWIGVRPKARGRGLGTELAGTVSEHVRELAPARLVTTTVDEDDGGFASARGFAVDRLDRVSVVDPRSVDLSEFAERRRAAEAAGYRLVTPRDVDLRALYEAELEIANDMPGASPSVLTFEEWLHDATDHPTVSWDGSAIVVREGAAVALSWLSVDAVNRRGRNEVTGTVRAHRCRGLAMLAKLATIAWARENGIEEIVTDNAEENVGMLAINERLGYRPLLVRRRWVKALT
jgi:RimJ/RimL family protein N-acetyltransferase/GNAT superfamily N-acetyltransferase